MSMKMFPLIEITSANSFERGLQYGSQAQEWIDICVSHYRERFVNGGQTWEQVKEYAMKYVDVIKKKMPDALEEARGIAEGSGRSLEEIMVVNCRYEISKFPKVSECTTAAVLPEAAGDNKMYLIKNWDYSRYIMPHIVMLRIRDENGYKAFGMTEAGQMVRDGFNSYGVAFVNNNLQSVHDHPGSGLPATFIRKRLWECRSFEEACRFIAEADRCVSCNTMIAHRDAGARDFEAYPGGADTIDPKDGMLVHANHFVVNPELDALKDRPKNRDARLLELLEEKKGRITLEHIMECMKDHKYYPLSICGHPADDGDAYGKDRMTVSTTIMNLTDNEAYVCVGNPCEGEFVKFEL